MYPHHILHLLASILKEEGQVYHRTQVYPFLSAYFSLLKLSQRGFFFFFWVKGLTWGSYAVHGPEEITNAGDCIYVNYPSSRVTIFFGKGTFDHALLKRSQCCGAVPPVCRCCRQRFVGVRPRGTMTVLPSSRNTDPMGFNRPLPSNMSAVSIREQVYRYPQTLARRSPRQPGYPGLSPPHETLPNH